MVFSQIPDIVFAKYGLMLTGCFKIWSHKDLVYDKRAVEKAILLFLVFWILKFDITFAKNLMKKKHTICIFKVLVFTKFIVLETFHCKMTVLWIFLEFERKAIILTASFY